MAFKLILIAFLFSAIEAADVFSSVEHLEKLAVGEEQMLYAFDNFLEQEELRLEKMETLLQGIEEVHKHPDANDTYNFVGHPLNAFHLIKRFVTKWTELFEALDDFSHQKPLKEVADEYKHVLPHEPDYDGVLLSVLRLQKTYGLRTEDISEGWIFHRRANPLGHEHMYDLGVVALNKAGEPDLAEEWLKTARNVERPPVADLSTVDAVYRQVRDQNKERRATEQPTQEDATLTSYKEICKKSIYEEFIPAFPQDVMCYHHPIKRVPWYVHKVELLQRSPEVAMIHDFVTDAEAASIQAHVARTMTRAKVGLSEQARPSDVRVGKVQFVWDEEGAAFRKLSARISELTGLNTTYPTGEPLQVVNYGVGGQYDPHHDFDFFRYTRESESEEIRTQGDRIATFMVYLNDVELGGATVFPLSQLFVKPEKNAALFWYNYDQMGRGDGRTLHAGCPVVLGQKWIANKWIREHGQELVQPCLKLTKQEEDLLLAEQHL